MTGKKRPKGALFVPDPPLAKPCVSGTMLGLWPRTDPDCRALRLLSCKCTIARASAPLLRKVPPARSFVPAGPKPFALGLGSRRLRRRHACAPGHLPVLWPGAPANTAARVRASAHAPRRISTSADICRSGYLSTDISLCSTVSSHQSRDGRPAQEDRAMWSYPVVPGRRLHQDVGLTDRLM